MIQANALIAITMSAERWELVLRLLSRVEAPHFMTDPLIREIQQQCMREDRPEHVASEARQNVTQFQEAAC